MVMIQNLHQAFPRFGLLRMLCGQSIGCKYSRGQLYTICTTDDALQKAVVGAVSMFVKVGLT